VACCVFGQQVPRNKRISGARQNARLDTLTPPSLRQVRPPKHPRACEITPAYANSVRFVPKGFKGSSLKHSPFVSPAQSPVCKADPDDGQTYYILNHNNTLSNQANSSTVLSISLCGCLMLQLQVHLYKMSSGLATGLSIDMRLTAAKSLTQRRRPLYRRWLRHQQPSQV